VDNVLTASLAVEYDLGSAYCTDKWDTRSTANTCVESI
jgi:hypothetical protein